MHSPAHCQSKNCAALTRDDRSYDLGPAGLCSACTTREALARLEELAPEDDSSGLAMLALALIGRDEREHRQNFDFVAQRIERVWAAGRTVVLKAPARVEIEVIDFSGLRSAS